MSNKKNLIKKGAKVKWSSSGRGSRHTKTGTVLGFLESRKDVFSRIPKKTPVSRVMTRLYKSQHERYLVAVKNKGGETLFYTPRAVTVNEQNGHKPATSIKRAAKKKAAPARKKAA